MSVRGLSTLWGRGGIGKSERPTRRVRGASLVPRMGSGAAQDIASPLPPPLVGEPRNRSPLTRSEIHKITIDAYNRSFQRLNRNGDDDDVGLGDRVTIR